MIVGIDQSLRSTAMVAIRTDGGLEDFAISCPPKEADTEHLILWQWHAVQKFIETQMGLRKQKITGVALEGLSFNAKGSGKDALAGLFWYLKIAMMLHFSHPVGVIPVTAWRCGVVDKDERKSLSVMKVKDGIKKATIAKLPFEVKAVFEEYIRVNKFKKESLYDLTDAYFIAQYRLSLES